MCVCVWVRFADEDSRPREALKTEAATPHYNVLYYSAYHIIIHYNVSYCVSQRSPENGGRHPRNPVAAARIGRPVRCTVLYTIVLYTVCTLHNCPLHSLCFTPLPCTLHDTERCDAARYDLWRVGIGGQIIAMQCNMYNICIMCEYIYIYIYIYI